MFNRAVSTPTARPESLLNNGRAGCCCMSSYWVYSFPQKFHRFVSGTECAKSCIGGALARVTVLPYGHVQRARLRDGARDYTTEGLVATSTIRGLNRANKCHLFCVVPDLTGHVRIVPVLCMCWAAQQRALLQLEPNILATLKVLVVRLARGATSNRKVFLF